MCLWHVFTNDRFFDLSVEEFYLVLKENKKNFAKKKTHWFIDSEFVKTCHEPVIRTSYRIVMYIQVSKLILTKKIHNWFLFHDVLQVIKWGEMKLKDNQIAIKWMIILIGIVLRYVPELKLLFETYPGSSMSSLVLLTKVSMASLSTFPEVILVK